MLNFNQYINIVNILEDVYNVVDKDGTIITEHIFNESNECCILPDDCEFYCLEDTMIEAEYQGREVTLNKPTKGDVKKFKVYVKNNKGNVVKVEFGDPNMTIKKHIPARRKSFRARHKCDTPGPKTKARYWSCKNW